MVFFMGSGCERLRVWCRRESGFDLDVRDHLRHAFHYIGALEGVARFIAGAPAVARTFHDRGADVGRRSG